MAPDNEENGIPTAEEDDDDDSQEKTAANAATAAAATPLSKLAPWPEEDNAHLSWLMQRWQRLTYSYMNPVLRKGCQQTLDDGTHLSEHDLFRVPTTLESSFLEQKFE